MTARARTTADWLIDTYCATVRKLRAGGMSEAEIVREMKRRTEGEANG